MRTSSIDARRIVAAGYDAAADEFAQWASAIVDTGRRRYEDAFCARLAPGSRVLELGCGGGLLTTERLARDFALTGVDISGRQVALARARVPGGTFVQGDMTRFHLAASSVDGVAACYSLIHLPYGELEGMLARISEWLREGGVLLASLGARGPGEHIEADWLAGAAMYWSSYAVDDYLQFLETAGLMVLEASVETNIEDGVAAPFLWVVAEKREQRG